MARMGSEPNLTGKVALVTGSAKGLGAAMAIALASHGAKVAVHYRTSKKEAEETVQAIEKYVEGPLLVQGDVTDEKDAQRLIATVTETFGRLDILVNNVGNFLFKPMEETESWEFRDVIESNLYSVFYMTKAGLPIMREQRYGRIISFGNVGAEKLPIRPNTTPYFIAKAGVLTLTKILAQEEAKWGITINAISPGILETSQVTLPVPIGRAAAFSDIINALLFLLKEESSYITGANIEVSGGLTF
ncbi:MAG: short-chain dehydrogenase/reductase [Dehalococcoidia bacterium]|nr:short-chain dehydrogenase/reductase [Dehalococcoidia bacterium]